MYGYAFRKLSWGFILIMIDFRIQGIDILPNLIGYLLFASSLSTLSENNEFFKKAYNFNIPVTILSIFFIYEAPAQIQGIHFGSPSVFRLLIGILLVILELLVVYNLFMGIKEMAQEPEFVHIREEAENKWKQFLYLRVAGLFTILLILFPPLAVIFIISVLIASIIIMISIVNFMKTCETTFK